MRLSSPATNLMAALLAAAGAWCFLSGGGGARTSRPLPAALEINTADLNFGDIPSHEKSVHRLSLKNVGDQALDVSLTASCQCTAVVPNRMRLQPGGVWEVTLTISPPPPRYDAGFDWPLSVDLIARCTNDDEVRSARSWKLAGRATRDVYCDPPVIALTGPAEIIQHQEGTFTVDVKTRIPLKGIEARMNPDLGDISLTQAAAGMTLEYRHRDTSVTGDYKAAIDLWPTMPDGTSLPATSLPIIVRIASPFRFVPNEAVLPPVGQGLMSKTALSLQSLSAGPFEVLYEATDAFDLRVKLLPRATPWSDQIIECIHDATPLGARQWVVPIHVIPLVEGAPRLTLLLHARAFGLPHDAAVTP